MLRSRPLTAVVLAATIASACTVAGFRPALSEPFPSAEAASAAVLDALWQRDRARMVAAAVDQTEFRDMVWPHLPASRPEVGMPVDYLWSDTRTKSDAYLSRTLGDFGGNRLELVSVSFAGPTSDYGAFRIHRKARVTVRDAGRRPRELELFGSMIEARGGWKIFSYITD